MTDIWKNIIKTGLKYGVVGGVLSVVFYSVLHYLGNSIFDPALTLIVGLVILMFVFISAIEYRQIDKVRVFWKFMTLGVINYLIISLFISVFSLVLTEVSQRDLLENYVEERTTMMEENKANFTYGEEVYEQTLNDVRETTAIDLALDGFIKNCTVGLFSTIFISLIFHFISNKKSFKNQNPN